MSKGAANNVVRAVLTEFPVVPVRCRQELLDWNRWSSPEPLSGAAVPRAGRAGVGAGHEGLRLPSKGTSSEGRLAGSAGALPFGYRAANLPSWIEQFASSGVAVPEFEKALLGLFSFHL